MYTLYIIDVTFGAGILYNTHVSLPLAPDIDNVVTDILNGVDNCSQILCVRLGSLYKGKVIH